MQTRAHASQTIETLRILWPVVALVFLGFLAIGIPLPALSLYLKETLGYSNAVVGWAIGLQSIATLLSRHRAGSFADARGPKVAVQRGLVISAAAAVLYLIGTFWSRGSAWTLSWILAGRVLLGIGESLFITGAMSWGIARVGPARTGRAMAWQGIAMYGAFGLGAPIGLWLYNHAGFTGAAVGAFAGPLAALAIIAPFAAPPGVPGVHAPLGKLLRLIWSYGLGLALATAPFAAMMTYLPLHFKSQHWEGAGAAMLGFGIGYTFIRLILAHAPERFGPKPVAAVSLCVEVIGQAVLAWAPNAVWGILGATLTGIGFSLIFPSLGVSATRSVPHAQRGQAVGVFIAFFDLSLAASGPLLSIVLGESGYAACFVCGAIATVAALALVLSYKDKRQPA